MAQTTVRLYRGYVNWEATVKGERLDTQVAKHEPLAAAIQFVKTTVADARIGVKAQDIGSAVALACHKTGQGDTLWLK